MGLEEIDDGIWTVYFGPLKFGRLHERHMKIEDAYGRLPRLGGRACARIGNYATLRRRFALPSRRKVLPMSPDTLAT